jgi:hypothetical protein
MKKLLAFLLFFALTICSYAQIGTFSATLDSLETQDATTATYNQITQIGSTGYYCHTFVDDALDGRLYTFTCTSTGDIGAAVTDSWEWGDAMTLYNMTACWAVGYLAIAYDNNGTGKVSTIAINNSGAITKSLNSSYTFVTGKTYSHPQINRISGTNYYTLTYGTSASLWIKTLLINSGTVSVVDSLKITGYGTQSYGNDVPCRITGTNYFALAYSAASSKGRFVTFTIDPTNGDLGAALVDSILIGASGYDRTFTVWKINDSTSSSTKTYYGVLSFDNSYNPSWTTYGINPTNGDIGNAAVSYHAPGSPRGSSGSGSVIPIGDDWILTYGGTRTFGLLSFYKSDAIINGSTTVWAFSKQYGPTTASGVDILELSVSDSTHYFLYANGGKDNDAYVCSFSVKGGLFVAGKPGKIGTAILDSVQVCTNSVGSAINFSRLGATGTYWASAYKSYNSKGMLKTFACTNTGDLSAVTDSIQFSSGVETITEVDVSYTGGDYVGLVYEINGPSVYLSSVAVTASTGDVAASSTRAKIMCGTTSNSLSPIIYRIQTSNWYAVVYGYDESGTASDAGWLKTYSINNSTGALGPSGVTTLHAQDSLKICTGNYIANAGMTRVGTSDYYAILTISHTAGTWKIYTIDINSTTGAIGNTWVDSVTVITGKAGATGYRSKIERLGTVNSFYLAECIHQSGIYWATVGISAVDGSIDNALTDTWDATTLNTVPSPFYQMGGDIFVYAASGTGNDGYLRTIEVDDTTAKFIPVGTKAYRNTFEFNPAYAYHYGGAGRLSVVTSANYQTAYFLFYFQDGNGKAWLETNSVIAELDEFGWAHKIWNLTFGKLWGITRSAVKKVFGL